MEVKLIVLFALIHIAFGVPVIDSNFESEGASKYGHIIFKRSVDSTLPLGQFSDERLRIRSKRSEAEECEQLELCKLHARSQRNFISAFQLYFVNKENARLWDHQTHSISDCDELYNC